MAGPITQNNFSCLAFSFVWATPIVLSFFPSFSLPLPDAEYCSCWKMMHLGEEKWSRPIGSVNYLACCSELFALFPLPVNKFLRYSTDQSKLTERMWSFYCVNLGLLSWLRWHWHLYIIFILLPVEQFQKYLQGKCMSPSVPGIINVPLSEGFHW